MPTFSKFVLRREPPTFTNFGKSWAASGADLTFAGYLAAGSSSECQTPNSTRILYLSVVHRFQHWQKCL